MVRNGIRPYLNTNLLSISLREIVQNKILSDAEIDNIKLNISQNTISHHSNNNVLRMVIRI